MSNDSHRRLKVTALAAVFMGSLLFSAARSPAQEKWTELKRAHFSIFYQAGFEKDAALTRTWLDRAEQVMKTKYGSKPDHYRMSIYLFPAPAGDIDVNQSGQVRCCTRASNGMKTGTIKLLTLSAPVWKTAELKSSLGLLKSGEDYYAKVLMSEYIPIGHYATQDGRAGGGWDYYSAPEWFVQGLQEYDGIFHTTENNRTATARRLFDWAKRNSGKFSCCSPQLEIAEPYNGGAAFMAFLADEFGEDIHARILRSNAKTFAEALARETKPNGPAELYARFEKWKDRGH